MMSLRLRSAMVGFAALAAIALGYALTPGEAEPRPGFELAQVVPTSFGDWAEVPQIATLATLVPRNAEALQQEVYDQTLLRTYRRADGATVMLAVAYGKRQRQEVKVHRPELCYVSQGFEILDRETARIDAGNHDVPVTRLLARRPQRYEPVTYWVRLGEGYSSGAIDTRLGIIKEGLLGKIPDGVLVRVSSVSRGAPRLAEEFRTQDAFVRALLGSLDAPARSIFLAAARG